MKLQPIVVIALLTLATTNNILGTDRAFAQETTRFLATKSNQEDSKPEHDPFALMESEGFGDLTLGLKAEEVLAILGSPESKNEAVFWGADGMYHQDWSYPEQGITINMAWGTEAVDEIMINSITITEPSSLTSRRGLGIGATRAAVIGAYGDEEDVMGGDGTHSFIAGSIYGGLIFMFEGDRVVSMFLGAAAE